jgi:predicted peptidase
MKQFCLALLLTSVVSVNAQSQIELKKASGNAMQFYLSLPDGWSNKKQWPVLVILEAAEKEFKKNTERFTEARGSLPFIIVAPIHVNNGNQGRRDPALWPYSTETWDLIDKQGDCLFNHDGILAIIDEVKKNYNGEDKVFISGFEAGTHALWPLVFEHPEKFEVAIAVSGNYNQKTCINSQVYSDSKAIVTLPIIGLAGDQDQLGAPGGIFHEQWLAAKKVGEDHGFKNISFKMISGKAHVPMPKEVFDIIGAMKN